MNCEQVLSSIYGSEEMFNRTDTRCISSSEKTTFCKSLVANIVIKQIPFNAPHAANFMRDCQNFATNNINLYRAVHQIKSVITWLKYKSITVEQVIDSNVFDLAFKVLANVKSPKELYQAAIDLMEIIIKTSNGSCEERVFTGIVNLKSTIDALVVESSEKVALLFNIFIQLAEKFLPKMIGSGDMHYSMEVLLPIIHFAQFQSQAETTFSFWHKVVESLKEKRVKNFEIFLEDLTWKLIANCQYKNIQHTRMTIDSENEFEKFRVSTFELVKSVSPFINSQKFFESLLNILETRVQTMEEFEAILFATECIAENVDTTDNIFVPKLVNYFLADKDSFFAIKYRSTRILGQLAKYLAGNKYYIRPVIVHLEKIMREKGALANVAAHSIEKITSSCKRLMLEHLSDFYGILRNLENFEMTQEGEESMIVAVSKIINYLPIGEMYVAMIELCKLQYEKINTDPLIYISRLGLIFQHVQSREVAASVMNEIWQYIISLINHYKNNAEVLKAILVAILKMIENVKLHATVFLQQLFLQLFSIFTTENSVFIIRFLKNIIDAIGNDQNCASGFLAIFSGISILTLNLLRDGMNFDALDMFLQLSATFINTFPLALLTSPVILHIIDLAFKVCNLKDVDVNKSSLTFLKNLLSCDKSNEQIKMIFLQIIVRYGQSLIKTLLESSAFIFDLSMLNQVIDIFHILRSESLHGFIKFLDSTLYQFSKFNVCGKKIPELIFNDFFNLMSRQNLSKQDMLSALTIFRRNFQ